MECGEVETQKIEKTIEEIVEKETADLMGLTFSCVCGRIHSIPIEYLSVKKGAVNEIKAQMDLRGLAGNGGLIFDKTIERNVVRNILKTLEAEGITLSQYPVGDGYELLKPEIELSNQIANRIEENTDFLFSAGSGVICDLTKNAAAFRELPFFLIATAPSMNGYTSSMAALTDKGIKKTIMVPPARAVFADIDILRESPIEMVRSGLGDIVSKSVCNADWKLSQLVKDTYFCPVPFKLTDKSESLYLDSAEEISARTEYGISVLTDGIMRSGLSMTIIGTSTPSSGAEHLISHYWDLIALIEGKEKYFHGVQVGVTTVIMLKLFDYIRNFPVKEKVSIKKLKSSYPPKESVNEYIERKFGKYAEGVKQEFFQKYMSWEVKQKEIEYIIEKWQDIWKELDPYIRPSEPVINALKTSGAAYDYTHLGKTKDEVCRDIRDAIFIRGRYTVLDLAEDLGILEETCERVL